MQFQWTVFFGDAGDAEARVYVTAAPIGEPNAEPKEVAARLQGLKIVGRVEGPKCLYSHTLPARIPVRFRGIKTTDDRAMLVAEAIVPDPNMWSSELPFLYHATVELRRGEDLVAAYEQDFGIRPLGVIGRRLVSGGKNWVPRAVRRDSVSGDAPLELWRETATVMVVEDPCEELCIEADRIGVVIFAKLKFGDEPGGDKLRRLQKHPSVAMAIFSGLAFNDDGFCAEDARNLLCVQEANTGMDRLLYWHFVQAFVVTGPYSGSTVIEQIAKYVSDESTPQLVQRALRQPLSLVDARAACDTLQAELAGKCDPAGYIV